MNESKGIEDIDRDRFNHKPWRLNIFKSTFGEWFVPTMNVACVGNMRHRTNTSHVLSWTFGRTVCGH